MSILKFPEKRKIFDHTPIVDPLLMALVFVGENLQNSLRFVSFIDHEYPNNSWRGLVNNEPLIEIPQNFRGKRVFPHQYYRVFTSTGKHLTKKEFRWEPFEMARHGDLILKKH